MPNSVIQEQLLLEHRQHLQHEAEQERLLAQGGQRNPGSMSSLLKRIGKLFVTRSSVRKPAERNDEFFADRIEESGRESELQETRR